MLIRGPAPIKVSQPDIEHLKAHGPHIEQDLFKPHPKGGDRAEVIVSGDFSIRTARAIPIARSKISRPTRSIA
jgi:hypothetical protein